MSNTGFFAPLHGLRGIAIIFVLASHFSNSGLDLLPFLTLGGMGKVGVWLFFVLSAYLLTAQLNDLFGRGGDYFGIFASYFVKRFFRIYPLFLVALLIHLIRDISFAEFLQHIYLAAGHDELWAIPVEFKYYFAIPLISALVSKGGKRLTTILLLLLVMVSMWWGVMNPSLVFSNDLSLIIKAVPFLLGSLLAIWRPSSENSLNSVAAFSLVLLFGLFSYGFRLGAKEGINNAWDPWLALGMAIVVVGLVAASLMRGKFSDFLKNRTLVYFGEISFSLYLLHMFIVRVMMKVSWPPLIGGWLTLALCMVVAHFSYRFIETPGMDLGKKLASKISRSKQVFT